MEIKTKIAISTIGLLLMMFSCTENKKIDRIEVDKSNLSGLWSFWNEDFGYSEIQFVPEIITYNATVGIQRNGLIAELKKDSLFYIDRVNEKVAFSGSIIDLRDNRIVSINKKNGSGFDTTIYYLVPAPQLILSEVSEINRTDYLDDAYDRLLKFTYPDGNIPIKDTLSLKIEIEDEEEITTNKE